MTQKYNGDTKFAYGLTGYVRLAVLPAVYIADVFVRPSVARNRFPAMSGFPTVRRPPARVKLSAAFSSWNRKHLESYPRPDKTGCRTATLTFRPARRSR